MKLLLTIFFLLILFIGFGQEGYLISVDDSVAYESEVKIQSFADGSYCIAGNTDRNSAPKGKTFLRYFNACGLEIWSRAYEDSIHHLRLTDLSIDKDENIILAGNILDSTYWGIKNPFVLKIDKNGQLIHSNVLTSNQNSNIIHYTTSFNEKENMMLHGSMTLPNLNALQYIVCLENNQIKWTESYDLSLKIHGKLKVTSDGGFIGRTSNFIFKLDSLGQLSWSKSVDWSVAGTISNSFAPIEVDSGYVFIGTHIGAIDRFFAFMLKKNGTVGWSTPVFFNFYPSSAIVNQKNHLTLIGSNHLNGNKLTFLELNQHDGSTIYLRELNSASSANLLHGSSISLSQNNGYVFSGTDNSGTRPKLMIGKIDSSYEFNNCQLQPLVSPNSSLPISQRNNQTINKHSNRDLQFISFQPIVRMLPLGTESFICGQRKMIGNAYRLGNDTILCPSNKLILGSDTSDYEKYLWSTGDTSKTITITNKGTYWLEVTQSCQTFRDSITIDYYPSHNFIIQGDTVLCFNDSNLLQVPTGFDNYTWSNGSKTPQTYVADEGWYWVETTTKCDTLKDSIYISMSETLIAPNLAGELFSCPDDSVKLDGGILHNYFWSTGETERFITVQDTGNYWLTTHNQCDTLKDSIRLRHYSLPLLHIMMNQSDLKTFDTVYFSPSSKSFSKYQWKIDGYNYRSQNAVHLFKLPLTYKIELEVQTQESCDLSADTIITINTSPVIVPNVFTPNGDGYNDLFAPYGKDIASFEMVIYNQWGKEVFKSKGIPWDGRHNNGMLMENGQYFYKLRLVDHQKTQTVKNGTVTLLQ